MSKLARQRRTQTLTTDPSFSIVLCDDGTRTLKCNRRGVTWHSESGAVAESQLVFLENSHVAERLRQQAQRSGEDDAVRVLEVGFGTGLNFWLTASLALDSRASLQYVALDPKLIADEVLDALQYAAFESCNPAIKEFSTSVQQQRIDDVELLLIEQMFEETDLSAFRESFDAVYHDAFSPDVTPQLWQEEVFAKLHAVLKRGGRLVTYCVKSEIRKRLSRVGFEVSKTAGPRGGKREVLVATKPL